MGKRVRTSDRNSWSRENMIEAIRAVQENKMGTAKASKVYNVPRTTLRRRIEGKNAVATMDKQILGSRRPVFNPEQEQELKFHILNMQQCHYGLTSRDLRSLAFQLAEKNKLEHPFNVDKKLAGEDWLQGFLSRHPDLSLRSPEATSAARSRAFNEANVQKFFDLLKGELDKHSFQPHRIYNVDETSIGTVPTRNRKIIARKGQRQVGRFTSADRGQNVTAVICMSAGGNFVPPMIIFPRQRMKAELTDGAPPGTVFSCNVSGWMMLDVFVQWFDHFLSHAKPTENDPVLLILDGHLAHTRNLDVIDKARENNVTILCLPPHSTHRMQPLDVSLMFPLSTYYDAALEKWTSNHPGRVVTMFQISSIFCEAYLKAANPVTAINGFRKCGISPFNRNIFTEADFLAAKVTDQPNQAEEKSQDDINTQKTSNDVHTLQLPPCTSETTANRPSASSLISNPTTPTRNTEISGSSYCVSPSEIQPLPKITEVRNPKKRKCGTAAVLTSSPYKRYLEEEKKNKEEKDDLKRKRVEKLKEKSETVSFKKSEGKRNKNGKIIPQKKNWKNKGSPTRRQEDAQEEEDTECIFCQETYLNSASGEGWARCMSCSKWAHEECAGLDPEVDDEFICDFCRKKVQNY